MDEDWAVVGQELNNLLDTNPENGMPLRERAERLRDALNVWLENEKG